MQTDRIDASKSVNPSWPQFDAEVMKVYGGKWVVAVDGKIVAASDDPGEARQKAAAVLGAAADELTAVAVSSPESFFA